MQEHNTKRSLLSFLFGDPPPPSVAPPPPLSGFLYGEDRVLRLERIYTDAVELLRRNYAGLLWSRRAMGADDIRMGPRRWQSAYQMLHHSTCLRPDNSLTYTEQTAARRKLRECRIHYEYLMAQGKHTVPF